MIEQTLHTQWRERQVRVPAERGRSFSLSCLRDSGKKQQSSGQQVGKEA